MTCGIYNSTKHTTVNVVLQHGWLAIELTDVDYPLLEAMLSGMPKLPGFLFFFMGMSLAEQYHDNRLHNENNAVMTYSCSRQSTIDSEQQINSWLIIIIIQYL